VIVLLSIIVGVGLAAFWYHPRATSAQPPPAPTRLQAIENEFVAIADRTKSAVVKIDAHVFTEQPGPADMEEQWREFFERPFPWFREQPGQPRQPRQPRGPVERRSEGSGFLFREDGHILTNNHVVAGAKKIRVELLDGRQFDAKVIGVDKKTELAVIKIDGADNLDYLALGDSDTAQVGRWAIAIGMPFREAWSVTVGVISARGRSIPGETDYLQLTDLIQTDAAINPGNSGGPLLNISGEVIGINVAIRTAGAPRNAGIGYAVPSNTAKAIVPQLIEKGRVARGYLGIMYSALTPDQRELLQQLYGVELDHGMWISNVVEGSPADEAGFEVQDVLLSFGGKDLEDTEDLQRIVAVTPPGEAVETVVMREGKRRTLRITLGDVPADYMATREEPGPERTAAREDGKETVMGISVEDLDDATAEELGLPEGKGVIVTDIDPDSPAIGTTLGTGDVITKVQNKEVRDAKSFKAAVEKLRKEPIIGFVVARKLGDDVGRALVTIRPK
jgi:serine protease Do